jgi:hypothetical protein
MPSMEELGIEGQRPNPAELAAKVGDRLAHVDVSRFVNDMVKAFEAFSAALPEGMPKQSPFDEFGQRVPVGTLEECTIDGDTATGVVNGAAIRFLRANGRWFVCLPEPEAADEGGPEMDPEPEGEGEGQGEDGGEDGGEKGGDGR